MVKFTTTVFILILLTLTVAAQTTPGDTKEKAIRVNASVMNSKQNMLKGETVYFVTSPRKEIEVGTSDANGKFTLSLYPGTKYQVLIRRMTDTSFYAEFETPVLKKDEYSLKGISIEIEYDIPTVYTLDNIYFDVNQYNIKPGSYKQLDEVASYMASREECFEIRGYTDNTGNNEANVLLSGNRAKAIVAYLVKKGVNKSRLTAKALGSSNPQSDNKSSNGRKQNRRTEISIVPCK
jgi:OmpA-OmpF porin, OOP family